MTGFCRTATLATALAIGLALSAFDAAQAGPNGAIAMKAPSVRLDVARIGSPTVNFATHGARRDTVAADTRALDSAQEANRNARQMSKTAFSNFDQKSNQGFNVLSSVLKTTSEMRGIGAGNRSGL
jgi:hypothetical protein